MIKIPTLYIFLVASYACVGIAMQKESNHKIEIAESESLISIWQKTATGIMQCMRTTYNPDGDKPKEFIKCQVIENGTLKPLVGHNFWIMHMRWMQQKSQQKS